MSQPAAGQVDDALLNLDTRASELGKRVRARCEALGLSQEALG